MAGDKSRDRVLLSKSFLHPYIMQALDFNRKDISLDGVVLSLVFSCEKRVPIIRPGG